MHDLLPHPYNVAAYAARIGYDGPLEPTWAVLDAIAEHHVRRIPFENLDVLLGRSIDLEPATIERKLVNARRGGYCFEQNGLLHGVLRQIGFTVRPLSGRVRLDLERDVLPPRTHLFLVVTLNDTEWLVDVGVGGASLTQPIRFASRDPQPTRHETRRLVEEAGRFFHQYWNGKSWVDVYEFTGEPMAVIDRDVANWWTSTNPNSKFRRHLLCARSGENGERFGLLNDRFIHRRGAEILAETRLSSRRDLLDVLADVFGLTFPAETDFGWEGLGGLLT